MSRRTVYYLNTACQNCARLSWWADGTCGRCAREPPDSPQRKGKAKEKREEGEGTPRRDNHARITAEWPIWLYHGTKKADRLHMFWCISMPRLHKAIDEYQCWLVCLHSCCWVTVSPTSNCTAVELGNGDRMTIRQAKLCQAANVTKRIDSLGSKAVIPSYSKGEERRALVAGATGGTDGTGTMPRLTQRRSDTGGVTA